jgi:hypothetical protein
MSTQTRPRRRTLKSKAQILALLDLYSELGRGLPFTPKPVESDRESKSGLNAGKFLSDEVGGTACGGTLGGEDG